MFYSGLVVTCRNEQFDNVHEQLAHMPGVEVHQTDRKLGRLVVVLEKDSIDAETEQFRHIRELPDVIDVCLVVHRQDSADDEPSEVANAS